MPRQVAEGQLGLWGTLECAYTRTAELLFEKKDLEKRLQHAKFQIRELERQVEALQILRRDYPQPTSK